MSVTVETPPESKTSQGYVGRSIRRVEDPRLVKGIATYVDDIKLPGMLHAEFVRSPHANAKINSINTDAARKLRGVIGVFTGEDINVKAGTVPCAAVLPGGKSPVHTVLAGQYVYFVGHPVVVVVAESRAIARDALDLVEVDYEPFPAVTDPEKALEKDSPLTHPELDTNVAFTWSLTGGDVEAAFKEADKVLKTRMVLQRVTPMAMEPRGCVATWNLAESALTLWTSTQVPHYLRTLLPDMIGVPENKIRVVAPEVGGGFGSKLNVYAEEATVSYLSIRLGRPVKWIESRRENAACTIHGRDQIGEHEIAAKKDGTVLALRSKIIADIGSYLQLLTPAIPTLTGQMLSGCYRLNAIQVDITGVHTNKMCTDAYRGAGRPEAAFIIERVMDMVADEFGLDPVQVRLKNMPAPDEFPFKTICGLEYDSGNYQAALAKAQTLAEWPRLLAQRDAAWAEGRLFGVGLSSYVEICAVGPSKTMPAGGWEWGCVRMEMSAKVTVITGTTPHGQGQETSFAQIAADKLGVPMEDVVVLRGDTASAHFGRDTYGSRATALGGSAIVMSIDKVIAKAKVLAASLLGSTPEQTQFKDGKFFVAGQEENGLDWKRIASEAYVAKNLPAGFEPGLEASSFFEPTNCTFPFGTHIVAVEVDRDTGEVKILKYVAVDDCGKQINPLLIEGQVQGGITQALGAALMERTVYDENGQLLTGEFMDYAIPRAGDVPDIILDSTVTPSPSNLLGVKGVGEAGTIGGAPPLRMLSSMRSPLGIRHLDIPYTPERVWRAIEEKGGSEFMIPVPFDYVRPQTLEEALDFLARHGDDAKVLAGGHSLIPAMKLRLSQPKVLVDIGHVLELRSISQQDGTLSIGALTTHYEIESSELLKSRCPLLPETAGEIGDVQVRNKGTIGGSCVHADPAGDWPAAMLALDAQFEIAGPGGGGRTVPAKDFFVDILTSAINPGEILKSIRVPVTGPTTAYIKFAQKASGFAIAGVAAVIDRNRQEVSVGITGVAAKAYRAAGTESLLRRQTDLSDEAFAAAAEKAADGVEPLSDIHASAEFRAHLARVHTRRALELAASRG